MGKELLLIAKLILPKKVIKRCVRLAPGRQEYTSTKAQPNFDTTDISSILRRAYMSNSSEYSIDPMTAFSTAVTAAKNGSVGEIELEFRKDNSTKNESFETVIIMSIRREPRPMAMFHPTSIQKEE